MIFYQSLDETKYHMKLMSIVFVVMTQLESLVGDIQQATYSMMPATLARAPATQTQKSQQQQQFHTKVSL